MALAETHLRRLVPVLVLAWLPACGDAPASAPPPVAGTASDTVAGVLPPLVAGVEGGAAVPDDPAREMVPPDDPEQAHEVARAAEPDDAGLASEVAPAAEPDDPVASPWRARAPQVHLERDGRTIRGRVVDALGEPVADAHVGVVDPTDIPAAEQAVALTDRNGDFTVSSRRYDARWEGWLLEVRARGAPCLRAVVSGDAIGRTVRLPPIRPLHGELRFDDGSPVVDAELRLEGDGDRFGPPSGSGRIVPADARTDVHGRFTLSLPVDATDVHLAVMHDEHASSRPIDLEAWRSDPEGHRELALLERLASLEVELAGPLAEHKSLGRVLSVVAVPVERDAAGRLVESDRGRLEVAAGRGRARFDRLAGDWILWIADGRSHDPLDGETFSAEPGRHKLVLPLRRPGPWEPGIVWQLPVRLVDGRDETAWSTDGMPWPDVVATDVEGRVFRAPLDAARGEAVVTGAMRPPVEVTLEVAGVELRRSNVQPGDLVSLPVDPEALLDVFASLVVDVTALPDREGPRRLQLELRPLDAPTLRASTWVDRSVVRGLPPGRWHWELSGPELVSTSGELTVEPGGYAMVRAVPRK